LTRVARIGAAGPALGDASCRSPFSFEAAVIQTLRESRRTLEAVMFRALRSSIAVVFVGSFVAAGIRIGVAESEQPVGPRSFRPE